MHAPARVDAERHMRRALQLAARAHGRTAPNPMVGAVIVRDGRVLGEGYHHGAGLPHGEIDALGHVPAGEARGATVYVTLEPCNHTGRTGPCSEALIAAGVARVVAATADPNPVARGGAERLRAAGIPVEIGLCEAEARALNAGFFTRVATGRPLVTLKAAVTLDGRIAAASGDARWVTGEAARREAHRMRDRADAILVGAGTVRADDPALTTRVRGGRDPLRVILDGRLGIAETAQVVRAGTLVVAAEGAPEDRAERLRARGAEVLRLPAIEGEDARIDPGALLDALGGRGLLELLVEGGAEVHGAFLAGGLVDRVVVFVAPRIIGDAGLPLARLPGPPPTAMAQALSLREPVVRRLGDDVMIAGWLDRRRPAW